jgi:hypothetical protein
MGYAEATCTRGTYQNVLHSGVLNVRPIQVLKSSALIVVITCFIGQVADMIGYCYQTQFS